MIAEPINDVECLSQLTTIARELAPTTLLRTVAQRLGSPDAVVEWLQSLPQTDDRGEELLQYISCDVPQRVRLLPHDPNCVERALAALMLLETIAPRTRRALATVDRPLRHTGLVERLGSKWHAVDLFPRRNASLRNVSWRRLGGDVMHGLNRYVGKPVLKFYLGDSGGKLADSLDHEEGKLWGRIPKKPNETKRPPPPRAFAERAEAESWNGAKNQSAPRPQDGGAQNSNQSTRSRFARAFFDLSVGAANERSSENQTEADARDRRRAYDEREDAERVGRWWQHLD